MNAVNKAIVIGHLGADPDVRRTQDGRPVVSFSIATSESWKDKTTGERKQHTDWHRVVIFNEGLAGVAEKYLKKGSKAYVEGAMKTRKWTDKDGVDRYVTEIVLSGFQCQLTLLDRAERAPAPDEQAYGQGETRAPATAGAASEGAPAAGKRAEPGSGAGPGMDDEIPF